MSTNPYESPKVPKAIQSTPKQGRMTALRGVRIALLILLVPAVYVPIGVAVHLLAAWLYVPLFYRWYKMERSATRQMTT